MGVDFAPYVKRIMPILQRNWYPLISGFVDAPLSKVGKVAIEFSILKDGTVDISGIAIQASSGDAALDRAARGSIIRSDPLPRLPQEFAGQNLRLLVQFYYGLSPYLGISPCVDVRVPVGSTLQFAVLGEGITNTSVVWKVWGSGCAESACGIISDTGLYTAPRNVPVPPVVFVEATSRTDNNIKTKSRVTIVQGNPSQQLVVRDPR
jgi:TonB family protein